jgi:hypothetical protein
MRQFRCANKAFSGKIEFLQTRINKGFTQLLHIRSRLKKTSMGRIHAQRTRKHAPVYDNMENAKVQLHKRRGTRLWTGCISLKTHGIKAPLFS